MSSEKQHNNDPEYLFKLRHSTAHVLAQAVQETFPGTRLTIGPPVDNGFYYDFDSEHRFTPEDFKKLERRMLQIVEGNHPFKMTTHEKAKSRSYWKEKGEKFKVEMIDEIPDDHVTHCEHDTFVDLCRGGHVDSTQAIRHFKLLRVAGSYWRGDEKKASLQRIYGTVWSSKQDLKDYLERLELAQKRDHRKLGKELDLFSIHEEVGGGLVHWHPKGTIVRRMVERYWEDLHLRNGYQFVQCPHIASEEIYRISGHLEAFSEYMYAPMDIEGRPFRAKPMNCPNHIMIYRTRLHSYRELPIRLAELGTVYRFERSGVLHGLMRVRGFTIDDAHIFASPDQVESEVRAVYKMAMQFLKRFGFKDFVVTFSTRPEKYVGSLEMWKKAEDDLRGVLEGEKVAYVMDEGGGAFYGPKISVEIKDALGRSWQCSTIQLDFNLPERFKLEYVGDDGARHRPTMVHRALMGSVERFFGILIEHYGGAFPVWLAPVQAILLPITDQQNEFVQKCADDLRKKNIRVEMDLRKEKIGAKVRDAALQKIPYLLVVGKREADAGTVSVRARGGVDLGVIRIDEFISKIQSENQES